MLGGRGGARGGASKEPTRKEGNISNAFALLNAEDEDEGNEISSPVTSEPTTPVSSPPPKVSFLSYLFIGSFCFCLSIFCSFSLS